MKANEIIELLQKQVNEHGDCDVVINFAFDDWQSVNAVYIDEKYHKIIIGD